MAELVGSLEKIITIGLEIKNAVETVQQNKEECCDIEDRVVIVRGILTHLNESTKKMIEEKMEIAENPAMDSALAGLEKTLRRALKLVRDCQQKNILCLFCTARDMSWQLGLVQDDISRKMMSVQFATTVHVTLLIIDLKKHGACPPQPQPQDAAEVKITNEDDSTLHDSGCGGGSEKGETKVQIGSEISFATLPHFRQFSLSELKDATNNFSDDMIIGRGAFSLVYKGVLHDGQVLAVKLERMEDSMSTSVVLNEVKIGGNLEHKNVVKHLGGCMDTASEFVELNGQYVAAEKRHRILVLNYLPNGSVFEITQGTRHVDWSSCFQIIKGIAQGVHYLHKQRVLHSDLKPANILFDLDMNPVIVDFGISKVLDSSESEIILDVVLGSPGYMAPEHFLCRRQSMKSDVFAFGIILLEIVIRVATGSNRGRDIKQEDWVKMLKKAGGRKKALLHPTLRRFDESQLNEINTCVEVGLQCREDHPFNRPTMVEVVQMLNGEIPLHPLDRIKPIQQHYTV